jgi:hypothetical protein
MTESSKSNPWWRAKLFLWLVLITIACFLITIVCYLLSVSVRPYFSPVKIDRFSFPWWPVFAMFLLVGFTGAVYLGLPVLLSRPKRQRLLGSAALALPLVAICVIVCSYGVRAVAAITLGFMFHDEKTDQRMESVALPSGDVLENETYFVSSFRSSERYNRLYLKSRNGARELIKDFNYEAKESLLQQHPRPLELIRGNEKVLVLGRYILRRWIFRGSVEWDFMPSSVGSFAAEAYLKSFNKTNSTPFDEEGRSVRFDFDDLDFEHNVLTLRKTHQDPRFQFPEYLVFSAIEYKFPWEFDLARTREKNGPRWATPMPGKLMLDYSIIAFPNVDLRNVHIPEERTAILAKTGAREIFSKTLELSATNWADFKWSYTLPNGTQTGEEPEAIYGFENWRPGCFNILWRIPHSTVPWGNPSLLCLDDWLNITAAGFEGNISALEFVRLRREP